MSHSNRTPKETLLKCYKKYIIVPKWPRESFRRVSKLCAPPPHTAFTQILVRRHINWENNGACSFVDCLMLSDPELNLIYCPFHHCLGICEYRNKRCKIYHLSINKFEKGHKGNLKESRLLDKFYKRVCSFRD